MVDGLCPRCERLGRISDFDLTALFDAGKSANEGALLIPGYSIWHTSKHLRSHFGQGNPLKNIHLINLPPHSPIEHVWNEAKTTSATTFTNTRHTFETYITTNQFSRQFNN